MCRSKKLHLFEYLALRFLDELCHEEDAERSEEGVYHVCRADADAVFTRKYREAPSDDEVGCPLGKSANGDCHGTDAVVEHFAEHHPHDRAPCCCKEGHVQVCGNQGDDARCFGETSVDIGAQEACGKRSKGYRHADTTNKKQWLTADFIDKHNGTIVITRFTPLEITLVRKASLSPKPTLCQSMVP